MTLADDLATPAKLGAIADLLERSGIDPSSIARVKQVSIYEGYIKNDEGEIEKTDLHAVQLVPTTTDGPAWPVVDRGPAVKLPAPKLGKRVDETNTAVILPDIQAGYFRTESGLEPTHDEAAVDAALSVVGWLKPDQVVLVGDNADLPEFGRYRTTPAFKQTTQATIDYLTVLCARLRAAAPEAEITWLAGNHEERLPNWVLDNAEAAYGLKRGGAPESWPVLSIPYLCRMDEHAITYVPGYPASRHWITPRLQVVHGDKHTSNGSTAHKYLSTVKSSVIYGHIHRREYAARTREDHDGPKEIMAASPGCLARIDGAVPSTKGGTDLDGRPVVRHEDWQQGIAVVEYDPESGEFDYFNVAIRNGKCRWAGREFG